MKTFLNLKVYVLIILTLPYTGCTKKTDDNQSFKSDFTTSKPRVWVGAAYWSNPMQDWHVADGELICLVSKTNRNVHVLTKKLDSVFGTLNMSVDLQLFNTENTPENKNWVGFSIGSKGKFNDYRDSAVFGKGLNAGVSTTGNLFIGDLPDTDQVNSDVLKHLQKGVNLQANVIVENNTYTLTIALLDNETKAVVSSLTKKAINPKKMVGDLVLVSDYAGNSNKKSVAFKNWNFNGLKIKTSKEYAFGPILFSQYTLSKGTLKLTAQMAPVILNDEKVQFQIKETGNWKTLKAVTIDKDARTARFKIENWNTTEDIPYRLSYKIDKGNSPKEVFYKEGVIKKDPLDKEEVIIAGFTGNDHMAFPNKDITEQVEFQNPDVLFFSGDQIYEPNGGYGAQRSPLDKAQLDYLRKWYLFGWAFGDLMKDRPSVIITDDHDVYHGNIWGESGRSIPSELGQGAKAQDAGGYKMPPAFVKVVENTQTSHLPDPFDPNPVKQGIGVYYTDMVYGGISFAILEDRKFKSAPKELLPKANIRNGWPRNINFDPIKEADVKQAKLLGERQLKFLDNWVSDWSYQSEMKVLLSQTIFNNVATLPEEATATGDDIIPTLRVLNIGEYPPNDIPVSDFDSNAWPQTGRNKAVRIIRKGFTFHLAGDQHLGSTIQYGLEEWNDSGFAFCVPSIANHWPRRWFPMTESPNRFPNKPKYTGEFKDGFGNKMTVHATSNPIFTNLTPSKLYDRAAGYGIVRLNKAKRNITLECWPIQANPQDGDNEMYDGWPIVVNQEQNYGRNAKAHLPEIQIIGLTKPVVQIINESTNNIEYSLRLNTTKFIPKIFDESVSYTIKIGEPDKNLWQEKNGVKSGGDNLLIQF